ncbi:IS66 family insertion sequence element accessory protein TnpA [Fusibacter tunisiensis]|uniref:IS66 family insertion sequence element accessory protein TnpB n=1 Tax=Fusibacter tunisiensis TaxID=1008308 RepID=A0ABS2MU32_9FIRM|nr:hypothetical protein [Fusibacter tunisiensis]MBM7562878.1 hypothetical protein [Fusibacter tunisiensis]
MRKKANSEYWQQIVSDQTSSGLTQHEWCEQNNVNIHNFRYWKRRLVSEAKQPQKVDQTETKWAIISSSESDVDENNIKSILCIHIGKAIVEVSPGFDPESLSTVLSVLMKHV